MTPSKRTRALILETQEMLKKVRDEFDAMHSLGQLLLTFKDSDHPKLRQTADLVGQTLASNPNPTTLLVLCATILPQGLQKLLEDDE